VASVSYSSPLIRREQTQLATRTRAGRKTLEAVSALYYNISSQRTQNRHVALQFVASGPGEGTSLVASQFAAFAAQVEGGSALLIDCAIPMNARLGKLDRRQLPSLLDAYTADGQIDAALAEVDGVPGLFTARLSDRTHSRMYTDTSILNAILHSARDRFQVVALDTPSLKESAGTLTFCRPCDGVVLVVEAESTRARSAEATIEAITRGGGKVLGLVFNKRRMHMPQWLYRRL
jgi:Mrp family chromosome partitioning ATPase